MQNIENFSSLIGNIYDCALNPAHWVETLTEINAQMDGAYTMITLAELPYIDSRLVTHSPWDPQALKTLNGEWGIDRVPGLSVVAFGDVDTPHSTLNEVSEEVFYASEFYQTWVKPQGLRDGCIMKFSHTADRIGTIATATSVNRDIVTSAERSFMASLSPHLKRAAMIGDLLDHKRIETNVYRDALDSLKTPVLLVDNDCLVVYANESAQKLLSTNSVIRVASGILYPENPMMVSSLHDSVARCVGTNLDLGSRGIAIPVSLQGSSPAVAYVLPLSNSSGQELRSMFRPAAAAVFISTGLANPPGLKDMLCTLYDLTPSEARVAIQVFDGLTPAQAALQQGLSENTMKTHLARVFHKMGVSRQAELVKLVATLSSPILP
jgi:DNA-binding CsgD family transcriptional regulator